MRRSPMLVSGASAARSGAATTAHLPAPTGGWNTRDPLAAMAPTDAVKLTNLYPSVGEVVVRGGYLIAASGMPATVKSIYEYASTSGANKLLAVCDLGIWDISAGGTVGSVAKALTNGWWNAIQFTNSAGTNFLWGANGTDSPIVYDGATFTSLTSSSTPPITGVTVTSLIWPWSHKRRLFVLQNNSMSVWYFDTDSIGGTAHEFKLGPIFAKGGYLVSGASWTIDGGSGPDDYWVVVTSEGEVAVYQGTDISDSAKWSLVGVFYVSPPLGRRCWVRFGGDLLLLTERGAFPLSQSLISAVVDFRSAVSNKIQPSFIAVGGLYRGNKGWQGVIYPTQNALIINIPIVEGGQSAQFVMNTLTGSWCDFAGWNACCFCMFEGELYFGVQGGKVAKAWAGALDDNGGDIVGEAQTSYSYLNRSAGLKTVDGVRPLLATNGQYELRWGLATDFQFAYVSGFHSRDQSIGISPWDTSPWDTSVWSVEQSRIARWLAPRAFPGYNFSLLLQIAVKGTSVAWSGSDYLVNGAGVR